MKVLVTDDSRVMRQIVKRTLRQAGHTDVQVCEAGNGLEALDVIASEPDLVLCDCEHPEMNGLDLLTALRARGRDVPFGFVTSEGSTEMREKAKDAGALFLIAKPFNPGSLPGSPCAGAGMSTVAAPTVLPPTKALRETLLDLLGRDVKVLSALFNVPDRPHVKLYLFHARASRRRPTCRRSCASSASGRTSSWRWPGTAGACFPSWSSETRSVR